MQHADTGVEDELWTMHHADTDVEDELWTMQHADTDVEDTHNQHTYIFPWIELYNTEKEIAENQYNQHK